MDFTTRPHVFVQLYTYRNIMERTRATAWPPWAKARFAKLQTPACISDESTTTLSHSFPLLLVPARLKWASNSWRLLAGPEASPDEDEVKQHHAREARKLNCVGVFVVPRPIYQQTPHGTCASQQLSVLQLQCSCMQQCVVQQGKTCLILYHTCC